MLTGPVKKRMTARLGVFGLSAVLCCLLAFESGVEAKTSYTILPANTYAFSINDNGAVAGGYWGASPAFLRTPDGTITAFDAPGDTGGTVAVSINNDDTIAGYFIDGSNVAHGFVRTSDQTITTFDAPEAGNSSGQGTFAQSINALGTVAGYYIDNAGGVHGFVRSMGGTITAIDVRRATGAVAVSINDKGAIAGHYADHSSPDHGFVRSPDGKITTFDVPGNNTFTVVSGIDRKGAITGEYSDENNIGHGYIRAADGTFALFDAPGPGTNPSSINAKGGVTGGYLAKNVRKTIGFVRKPNGTLKSFHVTGANGGTAPFGINASGVIAGFFVVRSKQSTTRYGFIRTP